MGAPINGSYAASVLLTPEQAATARRLGDGNMSRGIRSLLDTTRRLLDKQPDPPDSLTIEDDDDLSESDQRALED